MNKFLYVLLALIIFLPTPSFAFGLGGLANAVKNEAKADPAVEKINQRVKALADKVTSIDKLFGEAIGEIYKGADMSAEANQMKALLETVKGINADPKKLEETANKLNEVSEKIKSLDFKKILSGDKGKKAIANAKEKLKAATDKANEIQNDLKVLGDDIKAAGPLALASLEDSIKIVSSISSTIPAQLNNLLALVKSIG